MMRSIAEGFIVLVILACLAGTVSCQDAKREDPNQLFYTGNHYYQNQDYIKAVEEYLKILDMGIENGPVYYNIGNSFLKLGKYGHAILCYEKAKRLMPHDSDLKSNLAYARSLVDDMPDEETRTNPLIRIISRSYSDVSLGFISAITLGSYLALLFLIAAIIIYPFLGRWLGPVAFIVGLLFVVNVTAFGVRYYQEVVVKHGIIVQKSVDVKYEPIDKSTTFYKLREGNGVVVLKTKDLWRRVRRHDGKAGWIARDAVEEI